MGCASSSPLVGAVPGGLVENAKATASDVMQTGENAMNGEYLTLLFKKKYSRFLLISHLKAEINFKIQQKT